jgi:hypothetical protein
MQVPLFVNRQVLIKVAPGANGDPSGTDWSDSNFAESQVAASAPGTACVINIPANKSTLMNFCLNMKTPPDSPLPDERCSSMLANLRIDTILIIAQDRARHIKNPALLPDKFNTEF